MAVRIRKLAKELNRSPGEILGVLHALGFQRYRSPDDMLPNGPEAKLRRGIAKGVSPVPVDMPKNRGTDGRSGELERIARAPDLMSKLVPGVVRTHDAHRAPQRNKPTSPVARTRGVAPPRPEATAVAAPAPAPAARALAERRHISDVELRTLEAQREVLESQRRMLASERGLLETERLELETSSAQLAVRERALEAESAALQSLRGALESEREALSTERTALSEITQRRRATSAVPLQELLEHRGLRGADEFERALMALADARLLREVLWTVRLDPPDALRRVLGERLLLVDGQPSESLKRGSATVTVAPERAEVPSAATLDKLISRCSERLLLHGLRRVRIVGAHPRWQRMLREGLDARIELAFATPVRRDATLATGDAVSSDLVVLWRMEETESARAVYDNARPRILRVDSDGIGPLLRALAAMLDD